MGNRNITARQLKLYCEHIMDNYKLINPCYENSRVYIHLEQFYNTGEVKGLIYKNTKREIKGEWLGEMTKKVNIFYNNHEEKIKLYVRKKKMDKIIRKLNNI